MFKLMMMNAAAIAINHTENGIDVLLKNLRANISKLVTTKQVYCKIFFSIVLLAEKSVEKFF